jgi:hypothetical protein
VNSPPPKQEVILTNFFAKPTVLLVPITSRVYIIVIYRITEVFFSAKHAALRRKSKYYLA